MSTREDRIGFVDGAPDPGTAGSYTLDELLETPFVRDTLFELAGGEFPVFEAPILATISRYLPGNLRGVSHPLGDVVAMNPIDPLYGNEPDEDGVRRPYAGPYNEALTHEAGHVADYRDRYPRLRRLLGTTPAAQRSYAATNEEEHFAEAFREGLEALRDMNAAAAQGEGERGLAIRMMLAERNVPGSATVVRELLRHPLYADSPEAVRSVATQSTVDPPPTRPVMPDMTRVATPSYQVSALLQARQRGFGTEPKGFGQLFGFQERSSGSTRAVERHQGPSDAVVKAKAKDEELNR